MTYKSYAEARAALPAGSEWFCSFGSPGVAGFCSHHRAPDGSRWTVSNGKWRWDNFEPFVWTCQRGLP